METTKLREKNQILGSPFEQEINDLRTAGKELRQISDFMWKQRKYKVSLATLARYFQIRKRIGNVAATDVKNHLETVFKEEYMDLVGRVAFFNEVILEARKQFRLQKDKLDVLDLMNLSVKMGDSLQRIEGADAQGDLIREFATLILETKMEARPQKLPIIEVAADGSSREILDSKEPTTSEQV